MSFILDALKKSESDRQRKDRPEGTYVPTGSAKSPTSKWLWIVGAMLVINVLVVLFVVLRPQAPGSLPVVARDTVELANGPGGSVDDDRQAATFKDMVDEARRSQPVSPAQQDRSATPANVSPPADTVDFSTETSAVFENSDPPSTVTTSYQTFNEVRARGLVQLPELHLDIHVYSQTADERFVFVNMSKYKEKATLEEGPLVAEIVPEGVVLDYLGTQFLLPRE